MVRRRRWARAARVTSIVLLVLVLGGAAAFGIDRGIVYGRHLWARLHRPSPPAPTTTTLYSAPTTTLPAAACTDAGLDAYLYNWRITSGTLYEVVAVTNTSATPCALAGYPTLVALGQTGADLPSPNHQQASLGGGAGATAAPVLVGPRQLAWFEFSYPVACSTVLVPSASEAVVPGDCFEGATLGISVSTGAGALEVDQPVRFTYGIQGFAVGPFGAGNPPASPPVS